MKSETPMKRSSRRSSACRDQAWRINRPGSACRYRARFVGSLDDAIAQARTAAGDRNVGIGGGGDVIRQALAAGHLDELTITVAPVILGGGKRLFEGFDKDITLEHLGRVRQSPFATHVRYRVVR